MIVSRDFVSASQQWRLYTAFKKLSAKYVRQSLLPSLIRLASSRLDSPLIVESKEEKKRKKIPCQSLHGRRLSLVSSCLQPTSYQRWTWHIAFPSSSHIISISWIRTRRIYGVYIFKMDMKTNVKQRKAGRPSNGFGPGGDSFGVYIERKGFGTLAAGRLNKATARGAHET